MTMHQSLNTRSMPPRDVREQAGISGIVPPMVTPLAGRDKLDIPGLERLIEHILAGGVHGLFILGTTGEGPSLSNRLKREVIERACALVDGRVPVLVGVTDPCFTESINLAQHAAEHGAAAVVIAPPYYFPAGQPELADYYLQVASQMPLPVVPYNMPSCTKINIEPNTLRLLLDHPNVVAYKDSSGQMVYLHKVIRLLKQYSGKTVLVGPEEMLGETTLLGGNGGVSGGANLFPGLYVALYEAAKSNDLAEVQRLHGLVIHVSTLLYGVGKYGSSTIKGIKCALSCLGVCEDNMADPFQRFHAHDRDIIRASVSAIREHLAADKG